MSFAIEPGRTLGMVGESGCGKSVTAFSILRLVSPPARIVGGQHPLRRPRAADEPDRLESLTERPSSARTAATPRRCRLFPSRETFDQLNATPGRPEDLEHRAAAIDEAYALMTLPVE